MKKSLGNSYSALQKEVISRLAQIEEEDQSRCDSCGGEDCVCCEIYVDRQRWLEPDELFRERY